MLDATLVKSWQRAHGLPGTGCLTMGTVDSIELGELKDKVMRRALSIALSEVGEGETLGNNNGPYLDMLRQTDGTGRPWKRVRGAWCATAVSSWYMRAIEELNAPIKFRPSRGSKQTGRFMSRDHATLKYPEPGAIGIYNRGRANTWRGHTRMFVDYDPRDDEAQIIEGNVGRNAKVQTLWMSGKEWRKGLVGIYGL